MPAPRGRKPAREKTAAEKQAEAAKKRDNFKKLASQRTTKAVKMLSNLQRLANRRNYTFDTADVTKIRDVINTSTKAVINAFEQALTSGKSGDAPAVISFD